MAKASLEFDLHDPDDRCAFNRAAKSTEAYIVLRSIDSFCRDFIKFGDESQQFLDAIEAVRKHLTEVCEYHGVDIFGDLP
jgi:hypothetical protein